MELSIFLAKILGLYLVIVSVAVWFKRKDLGELAINFTQDKVHIYLSGVIFLLLGLTLVISHNIWDTAWQSLISILGWVTLAKAGIRIFFSDRIGNIVQKAVKSRWYWLAIVSAFLMGSWLIYVGFSYQ